MNTSTFSIFFNQIKPFDFDQFLGIFPFFTFSCPQTNSLYNILQQK